MHGIPSLQHLQKQQQQQQHPVAIVKHTENIKTSSTIAITFISPASGSASINPILFLS
jgi:hypothetical protein